MSTTETLVSSLLAQPASDVLEFRTDAEPSRLAPTVVAFLNTCGGTIVLRTPPGARSGVDDVAKYSSSLTAFLSEHIAPQADLQIEVVEESGHQGIVVEVPPGGSKPYIYEGAIYVRRDGQTVPASPIDITRLVNQRSREDERWERGIAVGLFPDDLDEEEIGRTWEQATQRFRYPAGDDTTPAMKLQRMDLADTSWPRNAAIVLFVRGASQRRYPQLAAHATVFQDESLRELADDRIFEGDAFSLFDRLFKFVGRHLPVRSSIRSGDTIRNDRPTLPALVLREGILNAIAHREYQELSPIQLRLFPDRLEIWNPGSISPDLIRQPGASRPRNPDVARILYLRGLVEMRGVGMLRMQDEMVAIGLPVPQWENRSGGTLVSLPFTQAAGRRTEQVAAAAELRVLSERAFAYLAGARSGERITREEYQERYARDVAERSARNDLNRLAAFGYVRQVGAASRTAYVRTGKPGPTL
jgi:ATP-dependent DNA helicase RecG